MTLTSYRCIRAPHGVRGVRIIGESSPRGDESRDRGCVDRERGLWPAARSPRIDSARELLLAWNMSRAVCLVLCFSACTAATSDTGPDGGTGGTCEEARSHSDLAWIQANIFTASCALGACHRGTALSAGRLSLEAGTSHAQLVNTASTSATSWMRVVPSDTAHSYLLVAIGAQSGPLPSDGVMPLGSSVLCSEKRDAIKRWIEAGAPQ